MSMRTRLPILPACRCRGKFTCATCNYYSESRAFHARQAREYARLAKEAKADLGIEKRRR